MERDFMGLNSKDKAVIKEEAHQGFKESDGFEAFSFHQEGGIQQTAHWLQLHHETDQAVPVMMKSPFFRPVFAGAPAKLGGVPVTSHPVLPSTGSFFAHQTEPWYNSSKVASPPAQLTIFYGGMVNVYDGISPEKAQAILFMAGKGAFVAAGNPPQPRTQAPPMTPISTQPCSDVSSPISVSSHPFEKPSHNNETAKRVMSSLGQAMQSAVPQARKASLARFLEKRKERVMASFPYSLSKNTTDSCANSEASIVGASM